ncbi:hypothetical protein VTH06DRAFT_2134 [Thermothelomyces fergusii]
MDEAMGQDVPSIPRLPDNPADVPDEAGQQRRRLTDLPVELLFHIFSLLLPPADSFSPSTTFQIGDAPACPDYQSPGRRDLRNLRAASRRFTAIADELLYRHVVVGSPRSMCLAVARLMRNPALRGAVRHVFWAVPAEGDDCDAHWQAAWLEAQGIVFAPSDDERDPSLSRLRRWFRECCLRRPASGIEVVYAILFLAPGTEALHIVIQDAPERIVHRNVWLWFAQPSRREVERYYSTILQLVESFPCLGEPEHAATWPPPSLGRVTVEFGKDRGASYLVCHRPRLALPEALYLDTIYDPPSSDGAVPDDYDPGLFQQLQSVRLDYRPNTKALFVHISAIKKLARYYRFDTTRLRSLTVYCNPDESWPWGEQRDNVNDGSAGHYLASGIRAIASETAYDGGRLDGVHLPLRANLRLAWLRPNLVRLPRLTTIGTAGPREMTVTIEMLLMELRDYDPAWIVRTRGDWPPPWWEDGAGRHAVALLPPDLQRLNLVEWFSGYQGYGRRHRRAEDCEKSGGSDAVGSWLAVQSLVVLVVRGLREALLQERPTVGRVDVLLHGKWLMVDVPGGGFDGGVCWDNVVEEYWKSGIVLTVRES